MRSHRIPKASLGLLLGLTVLSLSRAGQTADWLRGAARAQEPATTERAVANPLADLNKSFRAAYSRARAEVLRQGGPVILTSGDNIILLRGGKRTEARVVPEKYHTLKAVAHVPLTVYVLLAPFGEGDISEPRLTSIREYRGRLDGACKALEGRLPEADLGRQRQIISAAREFLDGVLQRKAFKNDELVAFTRKTGPPVLANAAEAARVEIDGLHKQVMAWKADMTPEEWGRLRVVVCGSKMPRKGNLDTQYFAKLLGEPGECSRIVYAEGVAEEGRAMNLLGTFTIDTEIGSAFFDDKTRMHRDLLEDGAAEYLKTFKFE